MPAKLNMLGDVELTLSAIALNHRQSSQGRNVSELAETSYGRACGTAEDHYHFFEGGPRLLIGPQKFSPTIVPSRLPLKCHSKQHF